MRHHSDVRARRSEKGNKRRRRDIRKSDVDFHSTPNSFFDFEKRHAFNDGSDLVDEEPTKVHNRMKHRGVLAHRVAAKDSPLQTGANVRRHVVRQTVGRLAWNSQQAPNQHLLPRPAAPQILWSSRARVPDLRCPNCDFSCFAEIGPRWTEGGQQ